MKKVKKKNMAVKSAAVEQWNGITVRCKTGEQGNVPRSSSSQSPDIIMAGTTPLADPSILTDPTNYDNAYSNKIYIGNTNYLYVRGKNFTDKDLDGTWNLFYAPSNILLYPYLWEENKLATSDGNQNPAFSIKAGEIGASENAFSWLAPALPSGQHYCMIGLANTAEHGNPVAGVTNITSLAEIFANNANIAQRNVNMVISQDAIVSEIVGYDQGSEEATVDLKIIFKNIPKGSSYTFGSGTPLNGKTLSISDTNTVDNDFFKGWPDETIPANWRTNFALSLHLGSDWSGIPAGAKPSVEVRAELVQGSGDKLYHLGVVAERNFITGELRTDALGGPVKVITVGTVTTVVSNVNF